MPAKRAFVDTVCWVGLLSKTDQMHQAANRLYQNLLKQNYLLTTTTGVLNETANALSGQKYRRSVVEFYKRLVASPRIEIVFVDERLWKAGWKHFEERSDKAWSLTDCISMIVMREKNLTEVVTHDEHFRQAGFKLLL